MSDDEVKTRVASRATADDGSNRRGGSGGGGSGLCAGSYFGDAVVRVPWWWATVGLVSVRIVLANRAPITDCDEVYNYWEPLHHLQFGTGMRTWEYAPRYALRTYAYLAPLSALSRAFAALGVSHKVTLFRSLRSSLAAVTAWSEVSLARALSSSLDDDDSLVPFFFLLASATSAGLFHAAPALLPSATIAQLLSFSFARYSRGEETTAVTLGLAAVLCTGWPFCAVLWAPMGSRVLWDRVRDARFREAAAIVRGVVARAVVIQTATSAIDVLCYEKPFAEIGVPTLNIFLYNAAAGGDELYGVEPFSFYVKNLLLNWNGVAVLAALSAVVVPATTSTSTSTSRRRDDSLLLVLLSPAALWCLIVLPRPHKEERFLFPIYPLIALSAAVALDRSSLLVVRLRRWLFRRSEDAAAARRWTSRVGAALLLSCGVVSACRSAALSVYYAAPLRVYERLYDDVVARGGRDDDVVVCVCGEWHRFPSSFFLPSRTTLAYLPSSFRGQLPARFGDDDAPFNDANREEPDRYADPAECDYAVELRLEGRDDDEESECARFAREWTEVADGDFLDAARTTSAVDRVLYLPWRRDDDRSGRVVAKYVLVRR